MTVIPLGADNLIMGLILNLVLCYVVLCGKYCWILTFFFSGFELLKVWWHFLGNNESSDRDSVGIVSLPHYQYVHHPVEYSVLCLMLWWIKRVGNWTLKSSSAAQDSHTTHNTSFIHSFTSRTAPWFYTITKHSDAVVSWHPPHLFIYRKHWSLEVLSLGDHQRQWEHQNALLGAYTVSAQLTTH